MAQLYDESVFEVFFDEDLNACFEPDSKASQRDPINVSLQVAHKWDEPMEIKMLPGLPP